MCRDKWAVRHEASPALFSSAPAPALAGLADFQGCHAQAGSSSQHEHLYSSACPEPMKGNLRINQHYIEGRLQPTHALLRASVDRPFTLKGLYECNDRDISVQARGEQSTLSCILQSRNLIPGGLRSQGCVRKTPNWGVTSSRKAAVPLASSRCFWLPASMLLTLLHCHVP